VPAPSLKLLENPTITIKGWYEKLLRSKSAWEELPAYKRKQHEGEWLERKEQFLAYLGNLIHSFEVREKTLKEKLTHQSSGIGEFASTRRARRRGWTRSNRCGTSKSP
jgi:hypothetical protein